MSNVFAFVEMREGGKKNVVFPSWQPSANSCQVSLLENVKNPCIKIFKVCRKHDIITLLFLLLYKNVYKQYKMSPREARASKVPAAARFLSSPVCLPSCTAGRRGTRREAGLGAVHSGKPRHLRAFVKYCQTCIIAITF